MKRRDATDADYTEGPIRGKCPRCGKFWTISQNTEDEWRNQCPNARVGECEAQEGEYVMDPSDDPLR